MRVSATRQSTLAKNASMYFGAIGRLVVEEERVLPHVHHQERHEAGDVADLVQRDPVIRELPFAGS